MKMKLAAAVAVALLSVVAVAAPAHADAPVSGRQAAIDRVLAVDSEAVQTGPDEVSWDGGAVTMTWPSSRTAFALTDCPAGSYCAWSGVSYTGTRLTFSACSAGGTASSVTSLSAVRALANRRSSGHVTASNGSTVVHDLAANTSKPSVTGTLTKMTCFT